MKELKNYVHFYLGAKIRMWNDVIKDWSSWRKMSIQDLNLVINHRSKIEIQLRKLSDLREEEFNEFKIHADSDFDKMVVIESISKDGCYTRLAHQFTSTDYLLSKHFDLFGLIESGLAIDATTLKTKPMTL